MSYHRLPNLGRLLQEDLVSKIKIGLAYKYFNNEKLFFQGNESHSGIILWSINITSHNKSTALKSPAETAATKETH